MSYRRLRDFQIPDTGKRLTTAAKTTLAERIRAPTASAGTPGGTKDAAAFRGTTIAGGATAPGTEIFLKGPTTRTATTTHGTGIVYIAGAPSSLLHPSRTIMSIKIAI
jgi:hypothetical protein